MSDHHPPPDSDLRRRLALAAHRHDESTVLAVLDADAPGQRVAAVGAAERLGLLTAERLCRLLDDPDPDVRRRTVEAVARIRPIAEPVLEAVLHLAEPPAPGSTSPRDEPTLPSPERITADDPVQEVCYFALGELERRDAAVIELLERAARHHPDHLCREAAVAALGALGEGRRTLLDALDDRATIRRRAVLGLVNFDGPDIDAAFQRALHDRDWQVRQAAEDLLTPESDG